MADSWKEIVARAEDAVSIRYPDPTCSPERLGTLRAVMESMAKALDSGLTPAECDYLIPEPVYVGRLEAPVDETVCPCGAKVYGPLIGGLCAECRTNP